MIIGCPTTLNAFCAPQAEGYEIISASKKFEVKKFQFHTIQMEVHTGFKGFVGYVLGFPYARPPGS